MTHDEVEHVLNAHKQNFPVVNIQVELPLDCVVDQHASLDVSLVILVVPMSLESDGDTLPTVRVVVSQSFTTAQDDSLGEDVRLKD